MKLLAFLSFCLVLNVSPLHALPHPECIAPNLVRKCKEIKCKSFSFPNCESLVHAYPGGDQCCDEETLTKFTTMRFPIYPYYNPYTSTLKPNGYTSYDTGYYYNPYGTFSTGGSGNGSNYFTGSYTTRGSRSTGGFNGRRYKRKIHRPAVTTWESHVLIYIDINDAYRNTYVYNVEKAIEEIKSVTCLTFEIVNQKPTTPHITFLKHTEGCASFVGKRNSASNPIVGDDACLSKPGNILALLAQALGLWHQTQGWMRDQYVSFLSDHTKDEDKANFGKLQWGQHQDFGSIYDFASVTHYAAKMFSKDGKYTIAPFSNDFISTMGQRVELSFLDARALNLLYCSDRCKGTPNRCGNGGYVDPKDCSKCRCQPGFKGDFCTQGVSTQMGCGGELQATGTTASITSPNFESGSYPANIECEWLIKALNGKIELSFSSEFDIYADEMGVCQNWVEVRYRNNVTLPGPRFCGNKAPTEKIESFTSDVVVIFKSKTIGNPLGAHKGFKLDFKAIEIDPCFSNPCLNGAQCLRINETYQCRCADGYAGDKCQTALSSVANPCSLQPCLNGGECEGSAGTFKCKCKYGFNGKYCEKGSCGGCGGDYFSGTTTKCQIYDDPPRTCNRTFTYPYCDQFGRCRDREYVYTYTCIKEQFCCDYAVEVNGQCTRLGWTDWTECSGGCGLQTKRRSFYGIVHRQSIKMKTETELCPYKPTCRWGSCSLFLSYLGYC